MAGKQKKKNLSGGTVKTPVSRCEHKSERKVKRRTVYLLILVVLLASAGIWGVWGKYTQRREQDLLVKAKMFYFTSNLLTEKGAKYKVNPQTTSITFALRNHIDELRESEDPIQYTVYLYENGSEVATTLVERGALNAENKTDEITFAVSEGNEYRIVAESISEGESAGYVKTIWATFAVQNEFTGFYKHLSGADPYFVILTVWTKAVSGDVTVSFPAGLIPDTTSELLSDVVNYSDGTYVAGETSAAEFGEFTSRSYRFFKEDPFVNYHVSDFTVVLEDDSGALRPAVQGNPNDEEALLPEFTVPLPSE